MTFSFSSRRSGASPFLKRRQTTRTSRHGIALLAVLACVVLLTIFVVSYISFMSLNRNATVQYSATVQAQEIAQGGLQDVLQDLHQEIIAGSVAATNAAPFTVNGEMAYIPCTNYAAAPARAGYPTGVNGTPSGTSSWGTNATPTTFSPTLIRVSRRSSTSGGTTYNPIPRTSAYPGAFPLNRASAASTLTASANGRYITAARWNKPLLLAPYASALPTPFTTVTANTSTAAAGVPDWVYVTRTGSRVCIDAETTQTPGLKPSTNPTTSYGTAAVGANPPVSPVVGRYAFIMYDEGALLDANVAGYPSTAPGPSAPDPTTGQIQTANGKSFSSYADLTQLPGLTSSIVDALIQYRNASANPSSSANNYLLALINYAKSGFLDFQSSGTVSDAPFLSRQDLINYFAKIDSNINTDSATSAQALPYLGTFSRASSAPSWEPGADVSTVLAANPQFANSAYTPANSSLYNYRSNAASPTQTPFSSSSPNPNPAIANVRFTAGGTITHYNDDASTTTYTVSAGDPLMQRRFSLARINWLTWQGPAANISSAAIQACFGLQWGFKKAVPNGGNPCWDYVGTGATSATTIETLTQVAAEKREPNFFEVLKAGILNGSIGLGAGPGTTGKAGPLPGAITVNYTGGGSSPFPGVSNYYAYDISSAPVIPAPQEVSDMQIIQIGANIIDQYDADSYPTAIHFFYSPITSTYDTFTTRSFGSSDMAYGEENLPYLSGLYSITSAPVSTTPSTIDGWFQPEVWNPYQPPNPANGGTSPPTHFQIRAYGGAGISASASPPSSFTTYWSTGPADAAGYGSISFTDNTPSGSDSILYDHPYAMTSTLSNISVTASGKDAAPAGSQDLAANPFYGFYTGELTSATGSAYNEPTTPLTIELGWWDGSNPSSFHPYSFMSALNTANVNAWGGGPGDDNGDATSGGRYQHYDPRTDRFSVCIDYYAGASVPRNSTARPDAGHNASYGSEIGPHCLPTNPEFSESAPTGVVYTEGLAENVTPSYLSAHGGNTWDGQIYYCDRDGVVRPGDGVFSLNDPSGNGNGQLLYHDTPSTSAMATVAGGPIGRRPIILNRPFRSVGELGYTYRDEPFKTLDFSSPYNVSADAGLLDLFSITDDPVVMAGRVNLNNAPEPVVAALLAGGSKQDAVSSYNLSSSDVTSLAPLLAGAINPTTGQNPITTRADLLTATYTAAITNKGLTTTADISNKTYYEAPIRALSNVTDTRTWNLMIDIIAQSGHMTSTATSLDDFLVQGEKRYWLHVAIDRYTGKIVAEQLEPAYE